MASVVDRIDGGMLLSIHYNISGKSSLSMWADLMKRTVGKAWLAVQHREAFVTQFIGKSYSSTW